MRAVLREAEKNPEFRKQLLEKLQNTENTENTENPENPESIEPISSISEEIRVQSLVSLPDAVDILNDDVKPDSYTHLFEMLDSGFKTHMLNAKITSHGVDEMDFVQNLGIHFQGNKKSYYVAKSTKDLQMLLNEPLRNRENCFLWSDISSMKNFLNFLKENGLTTFEKTRKF